MLTDIYVYLGLHVIAREVVFVDIALARLAALGATGAFLLGFELTSWVSYGFALGATLIGAAVLALTRSLRRSVSQEALIGVVYAVAAARAILVLDPARILLPHRPGVSRAHMGNRARNAPGHWLEPGSHSEHPRDAELSPLRPPYGREHHLRLRTRLLGLWAISFFNGGGRTQMS